MISLQHKFLRRLGKLEDDPEFLTAREHYKMLCKLYGKLVSASKSYTDGRQKFQRSVEQLTAAFNFFVEEDASSRHVWTQFEATSDSLSRLDEVFMTQFQDHLLMPMQEFVDEKLKRAHEIKADHTKLTVETHKAEGRLATARKKNIGVDEATHQLSQLVEERNTRSQDFVHEMMAIETQRSAENAVHQVYQDMLDYHRSCVSELEAVLAQVRDIHPEDFPLPDYGQGAGAAYTGAVAFDSRPFDESEPVDDGSNTLDMNSLPPVPFAVVALHPYEAQEDNELSFGQGDPITVHQTVFDGNVLEWWEGESLGNRGYFPANYVRLA